MDSPIPIVLGETFDWRPCENRTTWPAKACCWGLFFGGEPGEFVEDFGVIIVEHVELDPAAHPALTWGIYKNLVNLWEKTATISWLVYLPKMQILSLKICFQISQRCLLACVLRPVVYDWKKTWDDFCFMNGPFESIWCKNMFWRNPISWPLFGGRNCSNEVRSYVALRCLALRSLLLRGCLCQAW